MIELEKPSRLFRVHSAAPWSPRMETLAERTKRMRGDVSIRERQFASIAGTSPSCAPY